MNRQNLSNQAEPPLKNDPKDTQVLLHLLKTGVTQRYHDPLVHAVNDLQEFAQTHYQISLRKVRVQHSIMTHYLPLYFPEADRYYTNSRAQWFTRLLHRFPCPAAITRYSLDAFAQEAWTVVGRKVNTHGFLQDLYVTASQSVGLPVSEDSEAIQMFRVILKRSINSPLCHPGGDRTAGGSVAPWPSRRSAAPHVAGRRPDSRPHDLGGSRRPASVSASPPVL